MAKILVTGGLGALGTQLIPQLVESKHDVTLAVRRSKKLQAHQRVEQHFPDLPLKTLPFDVLDEYGGPINLFEQIWHMAALLDLGTGRNTEVWQTNVEGTRNVVKLAKELGSDLVFVSTAYTQGRNTYELSKERAEGIVLDEEILKKCRVTIFKPSIIIGTPEHPGPVQSVTLVARSIFRAHRKVDAVRRFIQDHILMPVMEPVVRLPGEPQSRLNVIPADVVATTMKRWMDSPGWLNPLPVYLTNPNPPTVNEVMGEIGEAINISSRVVSEFRPSIIERIIHREIKPLLPYMEADMEFDTVVDHDYALQPGDIRNLVAASMGHDIS